MIESIYEIGNSIVGNNIGWKEQTVNPIKNGQAKVIYLDLKYDEVEQKITSHNVGIEEFDSSNYSKYLFRKNNGSSANLSLCSVVGKDDSFLPFQKGNDKKAGLWEGRVNVWFGKQQFDDTTIFPKLINYFSVNQLANECEQALLELKKTEKVMFFTFTINGKYLGEIEDFIFEFQKRLQNKAAKGASKDGNKQQCFCCLTDQNVKGNSDVFKFYTIDKLSYIRGGQKKNAYLNYPICEECDTKLKVGREWIEQNASFKVFGMNLWFIPKSILTLTQDDFESITIMMESWKKRYSEKTDLSYNEENLLKRSKEIFEEICKETQTPIVFDMLFWLKGKMGDERILMHLQDVNEFRVHKLYSEKQKVDVFIQEEVDLGKSQYPYYFELYRLQQFFDKEGRDKVKNPNPSRIKDLLKVLNDCFTGEDFNPDLIIPLYLKKLKSEMHKKDDSKKKDSSMRNFKYNFHKSKLMKDIMASHMFFTGLFDKNKEGSDEEMTQDCFTSWFEGKKAISNNDAQQGLVLLGALTQSLLNEQQKVRDSQPFFTKLKSLQMNKNDIENLYPQIVNKLNQYKKWYPSHEIIGRAISQRFLNQADWNMTTDKMNMLIAFGMALESTLTNIAFTEIKNNKKTEVV